VVKWDDKTKTFIGDAHQTEIFRKLLVDLDIDQRYADLLVDWIDPDIAPSGNSGGEDTLYLSQVPPYRPPNTFITHASELLALPGFGRENYLKIAPYVRHCPTTHRSTSAPPVAWCWTSPQRSRERERIPRHGPAAAAREGLLSRQDRVYRCTDGSAEVRGPGRVEEKVVLVPSAHQHSYWHCGVRFVQSPLS
jgi:hypothetical protein